MFARRGAALAVAACCALCACSKPSSGEAAPSAADAGQEQSNVVEDDEPKAASDAVLVEPSEPAEGQQLFLDLQNALHLADYEHQGLSIGFGTSARMKYTVGHWKTGWGKDGVDDAAVAFTEVVAQNARLYVPLPG